MKVLHTSDWHLGRKLDTYDLSEAQREAVDFIVTEAIRREVNVMIIAGDVYDLGKPAVNDIKLLNWALTRLHEAGITVIVTAGNHDEAERLAANSNLMKENIYFWGSIEDSGKSILIHDEHGPVAFYPLTYLYVYKSQDIFNKNGASIEQASHQAVIGQAMTYVQDDLANLEREYKQKLRSIVVSHAFITPYAPIKEYSQDRETDFGQIDTSDSEKNISAGGIQNASADLFDGITYVALGHIHGPQRVKSRSSKTHLRYSGSILRYSMSEVNHKKSFVVLDLGPENFVDDSNVELVEIPQPRRMKQLIGTSDDLVSGKYADYKNDFVAVVVTDEKYASTLQAKIRHYFPYILSFAHKPRFLSSDGEDNPAGLSSSVSDLDVLEAFFTKVTGKAPSKKEMELIQSVIEEVSVEAGGHS